ncbi:MAG: hypothetical protein ACPIGG_05360 [Akkermansiaceae bacterium]
MNNFPVQYADTEMTTMLFPQHGDVRAEAEATWREPHLCTVSLLLPCKVSGSGHRHASSWNTRR